MIPLLSRYPKPWGTVLEPLTACDVVPALPALETQTGGALCHMLFPAEPPARNNFVARHARYHVHFTPTSGSWLNLVERFWAK
jgi:hypothetical protein